VRHIRSASNVAKLVLMFPDVENYYFEFPLKNRDSNISPEGTDIGISINTSLCQLLPEDPLVFDNKANTSNSLQEPRRLR